MMPSLLEPPMQLVCATSPREFPYARCPEMVVPQRLQRLALEDYTPGPALRITPTRIAPSTSARAVNSSS